MKRRDLLISLGALAATPFVRPKRAMAADFALGDEVFLSDDWHALDGRTVGVVTNQSGATSAGIPIVDAIRSNPRIALKALYAPEHGLRGTHTAGASFGSYTDERTGLPVYSLYGATKRPSAQMLDGVDVLLFDIQDVGSRAYTFISTMAYAMQGAKAHGKAFWVLDRPNPVGGAIVEGPVLDPAFASFIGLYPIAMRHGMTVGELARMFNDRFGIDCELHVVPMRGYTRTTIWPDTGLPWIRTSPNIPTWQTTFVYLCTGLIDNAGVNNGVGTARPFFYAGGRGVDGTALAARLNARGLAGVRFVPISWPPALGFWKGQKLDGVEFVVNDPARFLPVHASVEVLTAVRDLAPHLLRVDAAPLDRDWGTDTLRKGLLAGDSAGAIIARWQPGVEAFQATREPYLLYR